MTSIPYTIVLENNSRWTIALNVKDKTVKFLEEHNREYLHGMEVDKDFLDNTQNNTNIKNIDKSDII